MAGKCGVLAILLIALLVAPPSLVLGRNLETKTAGKASVNGVPMLRAVLGEALGDACNWCVQGHTYCCGQYTYCCGSDCCLNDCVGNSCG